MQPEVGQSRKRTQETGRRALLRVAEAHYEEAEKDQSRTWHSIEHRIDGPKADLRSFSGFGPASMARRISLITLLAFSSLASAQTLLLFTRTTEFRHDSLPAASALDSDDLA